MQENSFLIRYIGEKEILSKERRLTMKRFLILLLCLTMALPLTAFADGEGWYRVDSTSPNGYCYLYSKPSSSDSESRNLGKYINGQTVYVLDYSGRSSSYCYVQTQDGKTGYIRATSLARVWESNWDETAPGWYVVDSSSPKGYAYLYSKASDRNDVGYNKGPYYNGELVYVEDYYGGQDRGSNFCRVTTQDGKTGYMHDSALRPYNGYIPGESNPGALSSLPWLNESCRGTVVGADTSVYTGPSMHYYRTSSGKAYVSEDSNVTVYGREGEYYLIRYNATLSGRTVARCSMIPVTRLEPWYTVPDLLYAWQPIRIKSGAHLADAPDRTHGYNTIDIDREDAYALALIQDGGGETWVYFESTGWANTANQTGWKSVRGFVPASQVEAR